MKTLVKAWDKSKTVRKHSPSALVPTAFIVLPNSHLCLYCSIETQKLFYISETTKNTAYSVTTLIRPFRKRSSNRRNLKVKNIWKKDVFCKRCSHYSHVISQLEFSSNKNSKCCLFRFQISLVQCGPRTFSMRFQSKTT